MINKKSVKQVLGDLPLTAEIYWIIRQQGKPLYENFSLKPLEDALPEWRSHAEHCRKSRITKTNNIPGRKVLVFSTLRYWINHSMLLSTTLAGLGHDVTFTFLPYANWSKPITQFDLRRQNAYARKVLRKATPLLKPISLLDIRTPNLGKDQNGVMPKELVESINEVSLRDTQYTLQVEEIDRSNHETESFSLYRLRQERNQFAARTFYKWINGLDADQRPDVLITPNGTILEMGAIFQAARFLDIPTVTYEFGEQRRRIWFAQNRQVMHQQTGELWSARKDMPLSEASFEKVSALYTSRQKASLWKNFGRRWQDQPSQGGRQMRGFLALDDRPIVLLAANVIGDSLTLGRQVFSQNMTEWLENTIRIFSNRRDVQLVVRVHPGERYTQGPSVAELVRRTTPEIPENIHLIEANDPVNTYDLI